MIYEIVIIFKQKLNVFQRIIKCINFTKEIKYIKYNLEFRKSFRCHAGTGRATTPLIVSISTKLHRDWSIQINMNITDADTHSHQFQHLLGHQKHYTQTR